MALEFKPTIPSLNSMAGYGANAVNLFKQASDNVNSGLDSIANTIRDTADANATRAMIMAYDENNPMSINEAMPYIASAFPNARANTLEKLSTVDRVLLNEQANKDNLFLAKRLMDQYQADINNAVAAADVAGTKRANEAAIQVTDALGRPIRTDAYTLGEVDPLLNSASQRALQSARTQAVRQKAREELDTKNFNNYVASSSQNIAMHIPPSLYGTPQGAQMAMDLAMQAASKAGDIPNKSALVSSITDSAIKQMQWLQGQGIDTTLFGTPADTFSYQTWDENGNTKTITVDPRYADSTLNKAAIAYERAAKEEAIHAERGQQVLQAIQDTVDSVATNLAEGKVKEAQYALDTINGTSVYSDEQKALVNDQWKLYQLNQALAAAAQAQPQQKELAPSTVAMVMAGLGPTYNPLRSLAGTTVIPQDTQLQTMREDREKLAQKIKEQQEAMKKEQEVDRFDEIIKANDYSPQAQNELKQYVNNAVADATASNAATLGAVGSMLDKDGVEVGNSSLIPNIVAVMGLKDGKVPDDMGTLATITGSDGKPLNKEQASMLEGREVAELISKETTNMRGNKQLTTSELNKIQQDFNRIKRQIADTMQASNNFGGNAVDAQAVAASMAYQIIKAGIEKNSGLAALYDDYDYRSDDANATLQATLNILSGKDPQVQQLFDSAARNNMYAKQLLEGYIEYNKRTDQAYTLSKDIKRRNTARKALGQKEEDDAIATFLVGMGIGAAAAPLSRANQNLKGQ